MKTLVFASIALAQLQAESLPVIPMHMDPDQLARSLREKRPVMPLADCRALDLWECHAEEPTRVTDISLRWVQLDGDPELEAVLITHAEAEGDYDAYVFDKQGTWNLVGSFSCRRCSDGQDLIRVQKLTEDSPAFLLVTRDLGGSGSMILTTEAFQLRSGKLWPVIEFTDKSEDQFPSPSAMREQVLASSNRLVIHTVWEEPPGRVVRNKCDVRRWDAVMHAFVPVTNEQVKYCNPRTGKPTAGKSYASGLPDYP